MFIAEGAKIAHDILNSRLKVHKIYATADWLAKSTAIPANNKGAEINEVSQEELEKISALTTPQEVLLLVQMPDEETDLTIDAPVSLAVESIRDPGNLGTMIRICDWYGIKKLYCSDDCADVYNPKTVQATMGSIGRVTVIYTSLPDLLKNNKAIKSYAATLDGKINIHSASLNGQALLIIGNEAHGITDELLACTDETIMIPRFGEAESLNASIAAAVLVDNLVRLGN